MWLGFFVFSKKQEDKKEYKEETPENMES